MGQWSELPCLSILRTKDLVTYAGTAFNQVAEEANGKTTIHTLPFNPSVKGSLKEMLISSGKFFTFSDEGCYINFTKPILHNGSGKQMNGKAAAILNDSTIYSARMMDCLL